MPDFTLFNKGKTDKLEAEIEARRDDLKRKLEARKALVDQLTIHQDPRTAWYEQEIIQPELRELRIAYARLAIVDNDKVLLKCQGQIAELEGILERAEKLQKELDNMDTELANEQAELGDKIEQLEGKVK